MLDFALILQNALIQQRILITNKWMVNVDPAFQIVVLAQHTLIVILAWLIIV